MKAEHAQHWTLPTPVTNYNHYAHLLAVTTTAATATVTSHISQSGFAPGSENKSAAFTV